MQKKNWIFRIGKIVVVCLLTVSANAYSQVNFNITADNIKSANLYVDNGSTTFATVLSVAPTINLSASSSTLTNGNGATVNVNQVTARIIGTGGGVANLLDIATVPTITLSTSPQAIYSSLIGTLAGGRITLRYTLPNLSATIWRAGTYTTNLNFALIGINIGTLSPTIVPLNINVAAFVTIPASLSAVQLDINSLNYYRSQTASTTQNVLFTATVPVGIRLRSNTSAFTYSNGYSGAADPATTVNRTGVQITSPTASTMVNPVTSYTNLTSAGGLSVPAGNQQTNTFTYSISPANLKLGFKQKGTYTANLTQEYFDAGSPVQATSKSISYPVTVNVADIAELKVNHTDVNLVFNSVSRYANGVNADMSNHLTLSKTTPYEVYVKASGTTLNSANGTLPISIIDILPVPASGSNFNTVTLSASSQKLFSSAVAEIDRVLSVRYSVPASKVAQLLSKPATTYNTTITYTMVAP
ncbi:hypothetical protein LJ707_02845 [Mucilaginibacter sp. UR6-1]|uniref:hypothetical protein n=1 Tax=Mucilaginibacter sp. UR6-1 TaxID=1435643 RepID=UPI001E36AE8F|nr:hypothetical protein [Mucilaginibacter sp. UR6-1]MCC8407850.1 hypothetical protein [Mucilaginibacter sp. UR6-1]